MIWIRYCYLCVYLSYLFEGCVAFWFGLHQAEIGCHIHTPIAFFAQWFNWLAYNTYLQPFGSVINLFFYWFNGEYKKKVVFREFFGPLLDDQGNFRFKWFAPPVTPATEAEIEEQLTEFLTKFRCATAGTAGGVILFLF